MSDLTCLKVLQASGVHVLPRSCAICGIGPCQKCMPFEAPSWPIEPPKIVKLHDGRPSLNDIVGRLRLLADQVAAGDMGDVGSVFVILREKGRDWPHVAGYGDVEGDNHPIILCELAKSLFVNNIVRRVVSPPGDGAA